MRTASRFAAGLYAFLAMTAAGAGEFLVEPATFLRQAFDGEPPQPMLLWLTGERGDTVREILGHPPPSPRLRYWRAGERTVWILDEIGREEPITAGFVIENGRLANTRVLAFRESRGWEIRHEFFTDQFADVGLTTERTLDADIDNITGATLSVNAMKRMARVALFLDGEVRDAAP